MVKKGPTITQEYMQARIGIACPTCGNKQWEITHTRSSVQRVVRYRRCRVCGEVVRTEEFIDRRKKK